MNRLGDHGIDNLELLGLALCYGNVSKACRDMGVSRQHYYNVKKIYDTRGADALRDSGVRRGRPKKTSVLRDKAAGPAVPRTGPRPLERLFRQAGEACGDASTLISRPGGLMLVLTTHLGFFRDIGGLRQHSVIDAATMLSFSAVSAGSDQGGLAALLDRTVLPFYAKLGVPVRCLADCAECDTVSDAASRMTPGFCKTRGIAHLTLDAADPGITMLCKRFIRLCERRFLKWRHDPARTGGLAAIGGNLAALVLDYNENCTQRGLPCKGRTPMAALADALLKTYPATAAG